MVDTKTLKSISIFAGFSDGQLGKLAPLFSQKSFKEAEVIIPEQAENREMMILVEGAVAVEVALSLGKNPEQMVLTMENTPGRIIEWSSAIDTTKSGGTASARTTKPSAVLVADGAAIKRALDEDPVLGYRFMHQVLLVIASRLKDTRQQLVSLAVQSR